MRQWLVGNGVVAGSIAGMSSRLMAADPPGHSDRNVIYITWDGFRWQEFFGGAQELYISKDAGVTDVTGVKKRFLRETERSSARTSTSPVPNRHSQK